MNEIGTRRGAMWLVALSALAWTACDGEEPMDDAGPVGTDSGPVVETDAGQVETDAGPVETDAGPAETDAGDDPDAGGDPDAGAAITECATTIAAADFGRFVELCALDAPARHVRIDGVSIPALHASSQVVFGFADGPPDAPTSELEEDQFRVLLYGGGPGGAPPAALEAHYGGVTDTLDEAALYLNAEATVCFDVHPGAADAAPAFAFWIDGENGADCDDFTTLTVESAAHLRAWWQGATGAIDDAAPLYYRQTGSVTSTPTISVFDTAALSASEIDAALTCTTSWAANTEWQALCEPAAGAARHLRVEGVETSANSSYFYVVLGEDPGLTGTAPPEEADGKLILTGGQNHAGASWTWFELGADDPNATPPTTYTAGTDALYTSGPTTICMDIGEDDDGNARAVLWATGANGADCDDATTLTVESALYDSEADVATGAIWDAALNAGVAYVKTSSGGVSLGDVTVRSEAAAL